jgi:hypothetical protein
MAKAATCEQQAKKSFSIFLLVFQNERIFAPIIATHPFYDDVVIGARCAIERETHRAFTN